MVLLKRFRRDVRSSVGLHLAFELLSDELGHESVLFVLPLQATALQKGLRIAHLLDRQQTLLQELLLAIK